MKLKSFEANKFPKTDIINLQYPEILDTCLRDCLDYMFPGEGFVRFYLHDVVNDIKKTAVDDIRPLFKKTDDSRNLMFHIRDDAWLTEHLAYYVKRYQCPELETLNPLSTETLFKFVTTSPVFEKKRSEFEQHMIKAYINECLNYRSDDFFSRSIEKILETGSDNYDKLFRSRVINAMNYLGVKRYQTEIGLELNADMWRTEVMGLTFANRYRNLIVTSGKGRTLQLPLEDVVDRKSIYHKRVKQHNVKEFNLIPREKMQEDTCVLYDNWLCLREREYYLEHKYVIDQLGTMTPNMKISEKKSKQIAAEIARLETINNREICQ